MMRQRVVAMATRAMNACAAVRGRVNDSALQVGCAAMALTMAPEPAYAQAGGGLLSGLTQIIQDVTRTIALDWVFYLGILALVLAALAAKFGHISWGKFGVVFCAIGVAFYAPKIVSAIRDTAGASF